MLCHRLFAFFLLVSGLPAQACSLSPSTLVARYSISENDSDARPLILWRANNQVVQQRPDERISDYWQWLRDGSFTHTRYYQNFGRGVIMPPQADDWSRRWQLFADEALQQMTLQSESGEGCKRVEKYHRALKEGDLTVWWSPDLKLVVLLDRRKSSGTTTMKLIDFDTDSKQVNQFLSELQALPATPLSDLVEQAKFIDAVLER